MKKKKSRRFRQPRGRSSSKGAGSPLGEILSLRDQLPETLIGEIRSAVAATARALVEDEVLELVGEPWSRKGESPLRRHGATTSMIHLDGEILRRAVRSSPTHFLAEWLSCRYLPCNERRTPCTCTRPSLEPRPLRVGRAFAKNAH